MGQVQSYKRKITYLYQFHGGIVGPTAGFLKLEIRGDKVKVIINIQEPSGLPYKEASLYFYHETGNELTAVKVDEIPSVNGVLTYQTRIDWQNLYGTGRDLYTFDGAIIAYNKQQFYLGDFEDRNRKNYSIVWTDGEVHKKIQTEPTPPCEKCPYQKEEKEIIHKTPLEKMFEENPKIPMYGCTELFQCVRIHPRDIGHLDMANWKLGVNSFLTHNYYTYKYLLLGKMKLENGNDMVIVGIPGVYSNREKYLANMFGFERFVPVQMNGYKTGSFGYWISEINQS